MYYFFDIKVVKYFKGSQAYLFFLAYMLFAYLIWNSVLLKNFPSGTE